MRLPRAGPQVEAALAEEAGRLRARLGELSEAAETLAQRLLAHAGQESDPRPSSRLQEAADHIRQARQSWERASDLLALREQKRTTG